MELGVLLLRLLHWTGAMRHPAPPAAPTYMLYSAAVIALIACFVVTQVAAVASMDSGADIDQATLALCVCSTMVMGGCKIINVLRAEHLFLSLATQLQWAPERLSTLERVRWVASASWVLRLSVVYLALAASMAVMWMVAPLLAGTGSLPFVARFPFDATTGAGYTSAFIFQLLVVLVVGVVVPCMDLFTVSCIEHINSQLCILEGRVLHLNMPQSAGHQLQKSEPLYQTLGACVRLHQHIIREVDCLNDAVGSVLLLQVVTSAAGICFLLFQVAKKSSFQLVETGKLMGYLTFMLSQMLFYCWFGDDLLSKSASVGCAAYHCGWLDAPPTVKSCLLLMTLRAQRPLTLRAGKFVVFSRPTFVQILNASYSYFTVLRSMAEA